MGSGDAGPGAIDEMLDIASVRQVRALLADSPDAMIVIGDAAGTVLWASRPGSYVGGWDPASLIGTHALGYVHPDDRDRVRSRYARAASGETVQYTYRARRADGGWGTASTVAWGEPGESGPIVVTISSASGPDDDRFGPGTGSKDPDGKG